VTQAAASARGILVGFPLMAGDKITHSQKWDCPRCGRSQMLNAPGIITRDAFTFRFSITCGCGQWGEWLLVQRNE
jgi:hypothetical protein